MIIAVSDYTHLQKLDFCKNDGRELYSILRSLEYEIHEDDNLIGEVNGDKIRDKIFDFFHDDANRPDDTLLFYYSGHGVPDKNDDTYLASSDIDPDQPFRKGFSFEQLTRTLQGSVSTRIIAILDCCYSGAARLTMGQEDDVAILASKTIENKSRRLEQGQGKYILAASQSSQEAYALAEGNHSIFSYYLFEGLKGTIESVDKEGNVTPQSLGKYIFKAMMSLPIEKRPKQKPVTKAEESGDVILAYYPELKSFKREEFLASLLQLLQNGKVEEFNKMREQNPSIYLDFSGQDLHRIQIAGANLSKVNLSRSNLTYADLDGVNLYSANLFKTDMEGANLHNANISEAVIDGAIISNSNLSKANLTKSSLSNANLYQSNLYQSNLYQAQLIGADLRGTNLIGSNISEANTIGAIFKDILKDAMSVIEEKQIKEELQITDAENDITVHKDNSSDLTSRASIRHDPKKLSPYEQQFSDSSLDKYKQKDVDVSLPPLKNDNEFVKDDGNISKALSYESGVPEPPKQSGNYSIGKKRAYPKLFTVGIAGIIVLVIVISSVMYMGLYLKQAFITPPSPSSTLVTIQPKLSSESNNTITNNLPIKIAKRYIFNYAWDSDGTFNGQFHEPEGISIDPKTSDVYVADYINDRIQKFTSNGMFITTWGSTGTGNGLFHEPIGISIDPKTSDVYVADAGNNRIQKFTSNGMFITTWGSTGTGNGQFRGPAGISIDPKTSDVYVADTGNNRIQVFGLR